MANEMIRLKSVDQYQNASSVLMGQHGTKESWDRLVRQANGKRSPSVNDKQVAKDKQIVNNFLAALSMRKEAALREKKKNG